MKRINRIEQLIESDYFSKLKEKIILYENDGQEFTDPIIKENRGISLIKYLDFPNTNIFKLSFKILVNFLLIEFVENFCRSCLSLLILVIKYCIKLLISLFQLIIFICISPMILIYLYVNQKKAKINILHNDDYIKFRIKYSSLRKIIEKKEIKTL